MTKAGGVCGILAGGVGTIIWEILLQSPFGIKSAIITVPFSFAVIFIVSSMTKGSGVVPLSQVYGGRKA